MNADVQFKVDVTGVEVNYVTERNNGISRRGEEERRTRERNFLKATREEWKRSLQWNA